MANYGVLYISLRDRSDLCPYMNTPSVVFSLFPFRLGFSDSSHSRFCTISIEEFSRSRCGLKVVFDEVDTKQEWTRFLFDVEILVSYFIFDDWIDGIFSVLSFPFIFGTTLRQNYSKNRTGNSLSGLFQQLVSSSIIE